jgi:hypothetical protein
LFVDYLIELHKKMPHHEKLNEIQKMKIDKYLEHILTDNSFGLKRNLECTTPHSEAIIKRKKPEA